MSNVYDFAIQMENDGEEMYRDFAATCTDENLREFFLLLAKEEQHHAQLLSVRESYREDSELVQSEVAAENLFLRRLEKELNESVLDLKQAVSIAKAAEVDSINMYEKLLSETSQRHEIRLLKFIIEQEKQHIRMIEDLKRYFEERR